jgi:hypothetical protein
MPRGRSARREAEAAFYETINRVLGCISGDGLFVIPDSTGSTFALTFPRRRSELSVAGGNRLWLGVTHWYAVVEIEPGEWRVRTDAYNYTVFDADEREALGYHYHPRGKGEEPIPVPHLHVYQSGEMCGRFLPKVHLRTGRVALEDVVELLITDFGVEPRHERRDDWRQILATARAQFAGARRWASWEQIEASTSR